MSQRQFSVVQIKGLAWQGFHTVKSFVRGQEMWRGVLGTDGVFHLLGCEYDISSEDSVLQLQLDFSSKLWFTYRSGFVSVGGYDTDAGWGCMCRAGQMLLGQALVRMHLGPDWRVGQRTVKECEILQLFNDTPSPGTPFSLHHIVEAGYAVGKGPGIWFGSSSIAHVLASLIEKGTQSDEVTLELPAVLVVTDGIIYKDQVYARSAALPTAGQPEVVQVNTAAAETEALTDPAAGAAAPFVEAPATTPATAPAAETEALATPAVAEGAPEIARDAQSRAAELSEGGSKLQPESRQPEGWEFGRPVLVLITLRLGLPRINPVYIPGLRSVFQSPHCVGIIGGHPNSAHFFIGCGLSTMMYLDPHRVQPSLHEQPVTDSSTFHCSTPSCMRFVDLDPSLTVGFLCQTAAEFEAFCDWVTEVNKGIPGSLFTVADTIPTWLEASNDMDMDEDEEDDDMVVLNHEIL